MNWEMVSGIVRHILTFGGGLIVAKGVTDENTMMTIVSGLVALAGVGWSMFVKSKTL